LIFRFDGCIVDRVNLREGVVWSHPRSEFPALTEEEKEDEDNFDRVQMMAEDYIKMGMARVEKIKSARALCGGESVPKNSGDRRRHHRYVCGDRCGQGRLRGDHRRKKDALGGYAAKAQADCPVSAPYETLIPPVVEDKIAGRWRPCPTSP
jgi:quinone-modifying oxidoreductase subunit QmoB